MASDFQLSGPIDLEALDEYLLADHSPDDCMGLSDLDGFLTGIVVGPELILPSEGLPVIWGGEEPEFENEDEMRTVLGTIMGRYTEIVSCFNDDPEQFEPIFWEGPEGNVIASERSTTASRKPPAQSALVVSIGSGRVAVVSRWPILGAGARTGGLDKGRATRHCFSSGTATAR